MQQLLLLMLFVTIHAAAGCLNKNDLLLHQNTTNNQERPCTYGMQSDT